MEGMSTLVLDYVKGNKMEEYYYVSFYYGDKCKCFTFAPNNSDERSDVRDHLTGFRLIKRKK